MDIVMDMDFMFDTLDRVCPKCKSLVELQHYDATYSHPETTIPSCSMCSWVGDPE